jgi:tetratricopeptide (TPR) repeat protein
MSRGPLAFLPLLLLAAAPLRAQDGENEYELLLQDAQKKLQKGQLSSAERAFQEIVDPEDEKEKARVPAAVRIGAQAGLLEIDQRHGAYEKVLDGTQALASEADKTPPPLAATLLELRARALLDVGRHRDAIQLLQARVAAAAGDFEARWRLGEALWQDGQRAAARAAWTAAVELPQPDDGAQLAFRARCRWRLGGRDQFVAASEELVRAMKLAPDRPEPRTTYGVLQFEAYGEARGYQFPSGEVELKKVLEANGDNEEALLAMYRIRSANFNKDPGKTETYLERVLHQNPRCVPALVLRASAVLDDRRYKDAAGLLDEALQIDAEDRITLAHRAAAAWLLHDETSYASFRARALAGDPRWAEVDRIVGDHLVALYRFADSQPFFQAALDADAGCIGALHGMAKAEIYTGNGGKAKELLLHAKALEPGFNQPWRQNALAVQALLEEQYVRTDAGQFALTMHKDDSDVLKEYLLPIYLRALDELGRKYDFRPQQQVKVEVFHTWDDFSVRTIGFRGFTALGACFGPFMTLVSPGDSDVRKQDFMWEATVWHEYTHVLTLGLSKHRVPRWLTEGFSVYEEKARDPAWERGMDRDLFDAFHNRDIAPVRLLNRLFRGERILFGYYQGGLIVELLARDFGFPKAIELLRAFGDDLDTEDAFQRALGMDSRQFDKRFLDFVEKDKLRGMRLVPHFDDAALQRLLVKVAADADNAQAHIDLAWAFVQRDNPVDAGPQLAQVLRRDPGQGSALLARAEMLRRRGALDEAADCWKRGFAAGADDFDSRIQYGRALRKAGDDDGAEQQFQRAKACWPACTEQENAPELLLAKLYRDRGDADRALMEMKAYCKRTGRAYAPRWTLAQFAHDQGDRKEEARLLTECNRIDPFRRELHRRLGDADLALGDERSAALEFEVGAAVPVDLDREYLGPGKQKPEADSKEEQQARGELWVQAGRLRQKLGERERGRALLQRAVSECKGTDAAAEAQGLLDGKDGGKESGK